MFLRSCRILLISVFVLAGASLVEAQSAENRTPDIKKPGETEMLDPPRGLRESLDKLRIEKEKKEYDQMIERGQEAVKITEYLEKSYAENGKLTDKEIAKLESVEKLVTKIRSELGGNDDDDAGEQNRTRDKSPSLGEGLKTLRSTTLELFDELKKMTRFSISAAAIQSSNAILKVVRFLRFSK